MFIDITLLKISRDYRLLFFGQLVSFFGSMMTFVVVPWQMYQLTQSSAMVGYIYLAEFVPMVCLAFVGGALLASLTSGWTKNVHKHGLLVTFAAVLWGVAIIFFGLSDSVMFMLLFMGAAGFFDMISGIFRGAIWNQTIPNHLRGRLASIEMISYLTGPMLGSAKMGIVAERFSVKTAIVSGGILCVAAVGLMALFLPKFLAYDGREGVKQKEKEEALREIEMQNITV
ncbi:MAG: MFS transporter [Acidobacteria bacterium]|nr:MFS transporter [Acidobacteriota bacterium]